MSIERRVHPRAPVSLRIAYQSAGVLKTDYAENISRGGIFISTEDPFELGDSLELDLFCVSTEAHITVSGKVRWRGMQALSAGDAPVRGIGVEFEELKDPARKSRLEALIDAAFEPAPTVDPRQQLKVLIVDPNRYARELFRNGLRSMGREVFDVDGYLDIHEAADGLEALELSRGMRFNLYMVELRCPEVDGTELIRRIRRQVTQQVPIFAMARPFPGDRAEALCAGADVYLPKPVQLKPLFNTLKVLLKFDPKPGA